MRVLAYTYESDVHCPACARGRFGYRGIVASNLQRTGRADEHGLPYHHAMLYDKTTRRLQEIVSGPIDREGNEVRPIFSTDEHEFTHCGDCRGSFN